jgi:hypothetical protein
MTTTPDVPNYSALLRQPESFKQLHTNRFAFFIHTLPRVSYTCQSVGLPGIALSSPSILYPNVEKPHPGIRPSFTDLAIEFIVDQNLENYYEIWEWMIKLGFPEDLDQRRQFMAEHNPGRAAYGGIKPYNVFSDCTLFLTTTQHNPHIELTFRDVFPVALDPLQLTTTTPDAPELTCTARFRYEQYTFTRVSKQP